MFFNSQLLNVRGLSSECSKLNSKFKSFQLLYAVFLQPLPLPVCWRVFPLDLLVPEKAGILSYENIGSVSTGQAVGIEVISFLAVGMSPKLPIGKFQISGIL